MFYKQPVLSTWRNEWVSILMGRWMVSHLRRRENKAWGIISFPYLTHKREHYICKWSPNFYIAGFLPDWEKHKTDYVATAYNWACSQFSLMLSTCVVVIGYAYTAMEAQALNCFCPHTNCANPRRWGSDLKSNWDTGFKRYCFAVWTQPRWTHVLRVYQKYPVGWLFFGV